MTALPADAPARGAAIMVSYAKLLEIEKVQLEIKSMLAGALALQGQVDDHELRIVALEQIQAQGAAVRSYKNTLRTFLWGVLSAALGGGALMYLPKLWGG